jgi:hypothetical protein
LEPTFTAKWTRKLHDPLAGYTPRETAQTPSTGRFDVGGWDIVIEDEATHGSANTGCIREFFR